MDFVDMRSAVGFGTRPYKSQKIRVQGTVLNRSAAVRFGTRPYGCLQFLKYTRIFNYFSKAVISL